MERELDCGLSFLDWLESPARESSCGGNGFEGCMPSYKAYRSECGMSPLAQGDESTASARCGLNFDDWVVETDCPYNGIVSCEELFSNYENGCGGEQPIHHLSQRRISWGLIGAIAVVGYIGHTQGAAKALTVTVIGAAVILRYMW